MIILIMALGSNDYTPILCCDNIKFGCNAEFEGWCVRGRLVVLIGCLCTDSQDSVQSTLFSGYRGNSSS